MGVRHQDDTVRRVHVQEVEPHDASDPGVLRSQACLPFGGVVDTAAHDVEAKDEDPLLDKVEVFFVSRLACDRKGVVPVVFESDEVVGPVVPADVYVVAEAIIPFVVTGHQKRRDVRCKHDILDCFVVLDVAGRVPNENVAQVHQKLTSLHLYGNLTREFFQLFFVVRGVGNDAERQDPFRFLVTKRYYGWTCKWLKRLRRNICRRYRWDFGWFVASSWWCCGWCLRRRFRGRFGGIAGCVRYLCRRQRRRFHRYLFEIKIEEIACWWRCRFFGRRFCRRVFRDLEFRKIEWTVITVIDSGQVLTIR
mmetsp:Transcript_15817/g.36623  ORF Transcript_15817/g.36623 Transcript_15817/m.36623 type:complete len:307 (-) Transcript_15817:614-1534(-)